MPVSTGENPKQFMSLGGDMSLVAETFRRAQGRVHPCRIVAVAARGLSCKVRSHLTKVPGGEMCAVPEEPHRRNTLPAVVADTLALLERGASGVGTRGDSFSL